MPRAYPNGLLTSPALCTGVLITPASGSAFGYSDATVAFTYDGIVYNPIQSADASTIQQEAGTGVGNMEVTALINDAENIITSNMLVGNNLENSYWQLFQIDYTNPTNGIMILATYRLAKTSLTDITMRMELLGLLSFLKQSTGRSLGAFCDVLRFGDIRCDPSQTIRANYSHSATVGYVQSIGVCDFFGDTQAAPYYSFGDCTWTSGVNNGKLDPIKIHTVLVPAAYNAGTSYNSGDYATYGGSTYTSLSAGNIAHTPSGSPTFWVVVAGNPTSVARIAWRTPPSFTPSPGDTVTLCFGCDRRRPTCTSVVNTNNVSGTNVENHHGFYLPSQDEVLVVGNPI